MSVAQVQFSQVAKVDRISASQDECIHLPYIGLEHIESEKGKLVEEYQQKPEALLATKFLFTENHVLYGKLRPYLNKRLKPNFKGVCSIEILPILANPDLLDKSYLYFYFSTKNFVDWASLNVSGANLPRLSPNLLEELIIPLPPLKQQRRIAHKLEQADRLRRLRAYAVEIGDRYLQEIFLRFFGDPASNPKGWDILTLDDLKTDFRYGTSVKSSSVKPGLPVLRIPNILNRRISVTDMKYVEVKPNEAKRLTLEHGDILFVRTNGNPNYVGRCTVFNMDEKYVFASYLIRARFDHRTINPYFLESYLQHNVGRRAMQPYIRTTAGQSNISMEGLGQIPVPLPPIKLQEHFAQIVQKHERVRRMQLEALRQSEALYDTLLAQAFGEA